MTLYESYLVIFKKLESYCASIEKEHKNFSFLEELAEQKKELLEQNYLKDIQEIIKQKKLLEAYYNIAISHTSQRNESIKEIKFDETSLARIAVLIGNTSSDIYANQLYIEVTGQKKFLLNLENDKKQKLQEEKKQVDIELNEKRNFFKKRQKEIQFEFISYIKGHEYQSFVSLIKNEKDAFDFTIIDKTYTDLNLFDIGEIELPLPYCKELNEELISVSKGLIDEKKHCLYIPFNLNIKGSVLLAEYNNNTETSLLSGIQAVFLNLARYHSDKYKQVVFIDPIRFNNSGLGCLSLISEGQNSFVTSIPSSMEEIRSLLKLIIDTVNYNEHSAIRKEGMPYEHKMFVFHNFPQGYDESVVSKIRQLCVNAEHYGISIILTNNVSLRNISCQETLEYIKVRANYIKAYENGEVKIYRKDIKDFAGFKWFKAPKDLPEDIYRKYIVDKPVLNKSNIYEEHFDLVNAPIYKKGNRSLSNIPYGIDSDGNILYLDFDNSNFATFLCGAARSGKSTLLHTIITGILKNNHPDDVEIWLIDFKMTEFSRYTSNLPPHIRYVILDESPELVYDIIDRLTDILSKRQNIFKGKWDKLKDVPTEKYMPSIFVIIDEFSVMSQIIADSVMNAKDNYILKLQTLLAKGAALGLHFIFSSQGFTSGSRGLNDFSKKQIQQRIAMKTEVSEIKATLDLQSIGDDDKAKMEQLPVHHTLLKSRVPIDISGNYLIYSKVLFISESNLQADYIRSINEKVVAEPKYLPYDNNAYIDKKAMVIDGNKFAAFDSFSMDMSKYYNNGDLEDEEISFFIGEPRRMMPIFPITLEQNFNENLLLIGTMNEKTTMSSIVISIFKSLNMQDIDYKIIANKKNNVYKETKRIFDLCNKDIFTSLEDICKEIKELKTNIEYRKTDKKIYFLFGLDTIFADMSFVTSGNIQKSDNAPVLFEKRKAGELDIITQLAMLEEGKEIKRLDINEEKPIKNQDVLYNDIYDARDDLKYILNQGPKLGYRFVSIYNSVGEFRQNKLDANIFKHKIFLRVARMDATGIIDNSNASIIAELPEHCFRYTNGLDSLSFRPYLHSGISIDGWQITQDGKIEVVEDDDDNYLL